MTKSKKHRFSFYNPNESLTPLDIRTHLRIFWIAYVSTVRLTPQIEGFMEALLRKAFQMTEMEVYSVMDKIPSYAHPPDKDD